MNPDQNSSIDAQLRAAAREAIEVGVGFAVLSFQKAQVRRRELESALGVTIPPYPAVLAKWLAHWRGSH